MYSTYDDRRRPSRDMPPSSSARYYDTVYAQPSSRGGAPRYGGLDPAEPSSSAAYDRHHQRRRSVDESAAARPSRRAPRVVASDDGWGAHDDAAYPARSSRHDVETKTGEGHRRFREKRGGYDVDEAQNLRRAKSYSPRRAATTRDAEEPRRRVSPQTPPKSTWAAAADEYPAPTAGAGLHRSATTGRRPRAEQQYYDDDPRVGRGGPRGRGYEYGAAAAASAPPRPPAGDYPPYRSRTSPPPASSLDARSREKPYHYGTGAGAAYGQREPPVPPAPEPPQRGRYGRDVAAADGYPPAPPRQRRAPPPDDYDDRRPPYDRGGAGAPRARQRQSVPPPQARSRYPDEDERERDPYDPPRRRATSMGQGGRGGGGGGGGRYDEAGAREREYYDERPSRSSTAAAGRGGGGGGAGGSGAYKKDKGKTIGKQAGKLFMTHAFPVIKQEAVPFLTKAAQAYLEQKR